MGLTPTCAGDTRCHRVRLWLRPRALGAVVPHHERLRSLLLMRPGSGQVHHRDEGAPELQGAPRPGTRSVQIPSVEQWWRCLVTHPLRLTFGFRDALMGHFGWRLECQAFN